MWNCPNCDFEYPYCDENVDDPMTDCDNYYAIMGG